VENPLGAEGVIDTLDMHAPYHYASRKE